MIKGVYLWFNDFIQNSYSIMRRQVGGIPKTLAIQMEEGNYYEALQLYRTLQSRYWFLVIQTNWQL